MYGDFVKVEYNGVKYTVEPRKLDTPKTLEEQKQAIRNILTEVYNKDS